MRRVHCVARGHVLAPEPCSHTKEMPVSLLDLRAQHAAIRDEVVAAMMEVVDSQLFILGAAVEKLEHEVAGVRPGWLPGSRGEGSDSSLPEPSAS